ncbi:MAG: ZIP family metal transporter [Candidatus Jorgensenbacteria bacterium]|nr:ZIP family metal transporter [Candidatus Jorgensenbacteria bacterium]
MLLTILGASLIGSVVALVGGVLLLYREEYAKRISLYLVSFSAGALLGAAFFELLPEAMEGTASPAIFIPALLGIITLLVFEKFLKWYHCHDQEVCDYHTFSGTVLFGDAIHNFLDGVAIAASFLVSVPAGVATTVAVFFHEVPQEIGDFGALLHAGWPRQKVLLANIATALTTPLGALLGYFLFGVLAPWVPFFLSFTAGAFIYIAASDLIPEVRHREGAREFGHLAMIFLGILAIWLVGALVSG